MTTYRDVATGEMDEALTSDVVVDGEAPVVLDCEGARVVYGPGLDDINEWNDPC